MYHRHDGFAPLRVLSEVIWAVGRNPPPSMVFYSLSFWGSKKNRSLVGYKKDVGWITERRQMQVNY